MKTPISSMAARRTAPRTLAMMFAAAALALLVLPAAFAGGRGPSGGDPAAHDGGADGAGPLGPDIMGPGGMGGAGMGMHPRMLDRMAKELSLTDEQRKKIQGLFEAARPAMEKRREQMRADAELLRKTEPGDKDYSAVVQKVSRNAGELAASGVTEAARLRADVWAVLTPEQRSKARELGDQMRDRMKERREMRRERMRDRGGMGAPRP